MKLLITGAQGFLGSYLVKLLCGAHNVIGLIRPGATTDAATDNQISWLTQDLARPLAVAQFPTQIDAVLHLAQSRQYRSFPAGAVDVFAVNVQSTFQLLEYARTAGARTFVYASSGGVYGATQQTLVESIPLKPPNFYFCSKQAAEVLVTQYQTFFHTVILRPFALYGPGQRGMMIPNLLQKVCQQEIINIEGDPGLRINPLYVADAARACAAALTLNHSDIINIAGDETVSITELVNLMGEVAEKTPRLQYQPRAAASDLVADNTRMKEILGVTPQTRLREGLRAML